MELLKTSQVEELLVVVVVVVVALPMSVTMTLKWNLVKR